MDLLAIYSPIILINLLAWISPGPNMIAVMSSAMARGRRSGLLTGLGLSTGATVWSILAVLGVSALFELFPDAVVLLRLAGAGYLLWLGLKALRSAAYGGTGDISADVSGQSGKRAYLTGLLVSLTNPKAALFFGSILTAFVPANAGTWLLASIVLLCAALAILCHSITATVFSTAPMIRLFARARRRINVAFGIVFAGLGAGIAYDTLRRL
ncbi:LysE family translocator [Nisaea sediminum]|uniref:LysE family translocator n=1 Tax=Nisaea sediminum TaxID=2775867 RepID=UPI00186686C1|nr:LysE family translocator [Nisaea sediminum]